VEQNGGIWHCSRSAGPGGNAARTGTHRCGPLNWRRNAARLFARQINGRSAIDHARRRGPSRRPPAVLPSYRKLLQQPAFNNFCASRCAFFIGQTVGPSSSSSSYECSNGGGAASSLLASDKEHAVRFSKVT